MKIDTEPMYIGNITKQLILVMMLSLFVVNVSVASAVCWMPNDMQNHQHMVAEEHKSQNPMMNHQGHDMVAMATMTADNEDDCCQDTCICATAGCGYSSVAVHVNLPHPFIISDSFTIPMDDQFPKSLFLNYLFKPPITR